MIRFFSKIRLSLLERSKVARYLTYAVGEIILVVVGILIALQVNNWNEARKDRQDELKILGEIHANLEGDLRWLDNSFDLLNDSKNSAQALLNVVREDLPYDDSYGYYLFYLNMYPAFRTNTSGYQLLTTKGLELISNDTLRMALTNLYEVVYPRISKAENDAKEERNLELRPALRYYQGSTALKGENAPEVLTLTDRAIQQGMYRQMINFNRFKKDTGFHWVIQNIEITSNNELGRIESAREQVEALMEMLAIETQE